MFPLFGKKKRAVEKEIFAQFEKYVNDGFSLCHIDSHHHVHKAIPIFLIVKKAFVKYGFKSIRCSTVGESLSHKIYNNFINKKIKKMNKGLYVPLFQTFDDLHNSTLPLSQVCEIEIHPTLVVGTNIFDGNDRIDNILTTVRTNET